MESTGDFSKALGSPTHYFAPSSEEGEHTLAPHRLDAPVCLVHLRLFCFASDSNSTKHKKGTSTCRDYSVQRAFPL